MIGIFASLLLAATASAKQEPAPDHRTLPQGPGHAPLPRHPPPSHGIGEGSPPHETAQPHSPEASESNAEGQLPAGVLSADHLAEENGEAHLHHPEPFNFADLGRWQHEKELETKGEKDEHGREPGAPVTPYVYLLANFGLLLAIYYYAGRKPIAAGLLGRRNGVAKELEEAAKIKAEAQARLDMYSARLNQLDAELEAIKKDLVTAGEADRDRMVREAEEKADRLRKDTHFLLEQEVKQLRNDLLRHTVEAASAAAEAVLRSRVSAPDQDRLAEEYLKEVTALSAPSQTGPNPHIQTAQVAS
ncbi:MAG: hypothetical protein NVS3B20_03100 [Polyangiales bacterium]